MKDIPTVSVIIPAYNVGNYIHDALNSLQNQSYQDFEALIVDDGSTDHTAVIAQEYCQVDARFKLLQKDNGGLSSARNFGLIHSQAKYIALLDADDAYKPEKLMNHVSRLVYQPEVGVVYSASQVMRDNGQPTRFQLSGKPIHINPLLALLCKNFVGHGSNAVFRRCILDEIGYFDETLRSSEDVDFWMRIAALETWTFYREPHALVYYRVRPSGLSFNVAQMQQSNERVIELAYQRSPEQVKPMLSQARAYLFRYLARLSLTAGNLAQARSMLYQSLTEDASIFIRDTRAMVTLMAILLAPISRVFLRRTLGSSQQT